MIPKKSKTCRKSRNSRPVFVWARALKGPPQTRILSPRGDIFRIFLCGSVRIGKNCLNMLQNHRKVILMYCGYRRITKNVYSAFKRSKTAKNSQKSPGKPEKVEKQQKRVKSRHIVKFFWIELDSWNFFKRIPQCFFFSVGYLLQPPGDRFIPCFK